jgi:hypothetical protein
MLLTFHGAEVIEAQRQEIRELRERLEAARSILWPDVP